MCTIRFDLRVGRPRLDLVALSTPTYGPIADSNWEYQDIYWKLYQHLVIEIHWQKQTHEKSTENGAWAAPWKKIHMFWSGPSCRQVGGVLGRQGAAKTNILQNDVGITWHEESAPRLSGPKYPNPEIIWPWEQGKWITSDHNSQHPQGEFAAKEPYCFAPMTPLWSFQMFCTPYFGRSKAFAPSYAVPNKPRRGWYATKTGIPVYLQIQWFVMHTKKKKTAIIYTHFYTHYKSNTKTVLCRYNII